MTARRPWPGISPPNDPNESETPQMVRSARRVRLRLPTHWPWAEDWLDLLTAATGPPTAQAT